MIQNKKQKILSQSLSDPLNNSKQTSDVLNNSKTPQKVNAQISCTKRNGLFTTQTKPKKNFDYVKNYYQNIINKQESMKNIKNNTNISHQKNKTKF